MVLYGLVDILKMHVGSGRLSVGSGRLFVVSGRLSGWVGRSGGQVCQVARYVGGSRK